MYLYWHILSFWLQNYSGHHVCSRRPEFPLLSLTGQQGVLFEKQLNMENNWLIRVITQNFWHSMNSLLRNELYFLDSSPGSAD